MRKLTSIFGLILILCFVSMSLVGCVDNAKEDIDYRHTIYVGTRDSIRILQLTDLHLQSDGDIYRDKATLEWIREAVAMTKPLLVEVSGDISCGTLEESQTGIRAVADVFENMKQYWLFSCGNHEGEWGVDDKGNDLMVGKYGKEITRVSAVNPHILEDSNYHEDSDNYLYYGDNTSSNQMLFDILKDYKYCLARQDELEQDKESKRAMGVGNYTIDFMNKDGDIVYGLIHMDSHGQMFYKEQGVDFKDAECQGYMGLTNMQTAWYESQVARYHQSGAKSALFMHIPSFAFREATEDFVSYNEYGVPQYAIRENVRSKVDNFEDRTFEMNEGIYGPRWDDGLEGIIARHPSTNLVAVGHDHYNSFTIKRGVGDSEMLLSYGRCSGYNANVWATSCDVGATVYDINLYADNVNDMYDIYDIFPQ